jgi:hypothetical protein
MGVINWRIDIGAFILYSDLHWAVEQEPRQTPEILRLSGFVGA